MPPKVIQQTCHNPKKLLVTTISAIYLPPVSIPLIPCAFLFDGGLVTHGQFTGPGVCHRWAGLQDNALREFVAARAPGMVGPRSPRRQSTRIGAAPAAPENINSTTQQLPTTWFFDLLFSLAIKYPYVFFLLPRCAFSLILTQVHPQFWSSTCTNGPTTMHVWQANTNCTPNPGRY